MARSIQAIEKDLRALEGQAADLGKQFQQVYESYLQRLGEILRHQLALAGYQLCTQKYPAAFLQLRLKQQQDLQSALRQFGKAAAEQLRIEKIATEDLQPDTADDATSDDAETAARTKPIPAEYWLGWVQRCEQAIAQILQKTTLAANELLQKLGILQDLGDRLLAALHPTQPIFRWYWFGAGS
ncbi:MAG: hypothetical protein AAFY11_03965, partial [Cyanobacteria bacterium J06641_5]